MKSGLGSERKLKIPDIVAVTAHALESKGFEAYLIGGCTRDTLLGIRPKDWDITTNATPEEIMAIFPKTFYENVYGTVGVVNENVLDESLKVIEVTPYRLEDGYSDKRRPDSVRWSKNLEDDVRRRDFTINAIALRIIERSGEGEYTVSVIDHCGGEKDIKEGIVRAIGVPIERFKEDALRLLRAIRISTALKFTIESSTKQAIKENAELIRTVSSERVRDELIGILMTDYPMNGLILSHELGVLSFILPEIVEGSGLSQNQAHSYDIFEHSLRTLQHSAKKNFPLEVRISCLFHDIGKIKTRRKSTETGDWTFYGHDVVGSRETVKILERLRFPKKTIEKVGKLVRWHMFFSDTEKITLSAVRRLLMNVGKENIWDLMDLRTCDRIGTGRPKESPYRLRKYHSMIDEVMRDPITVQMLKINGARIMEVSRENPGPKIGFILHALLQEVLEDPTLNTPEFLKKRTAELAKLADNDLKKLGETAKKAKSDIEEAEIKKIRDKHWVD